MLCDNPFDTLKAYASEIADTDVLSPHELNPILQGLFGEVGGIMSTAKKLVRERSAYPGYRRAAEEEFGDALWYLAALCRRLNLPLDRLFDSILDPQDAKSALSVPVPQPPSQASIDRMLFRLGNSAAALLVESPSRTDVEAFASAFVLALRETNLSLATVAQSNLAKARGAFIAPDVSSLPDFDAQFPKEEQLPRTFQIRVSQRNSTKSYLQWNEVFIGDPLTDNIQDADNYRFHDVFHFAYAAILHWSPVRGLNNLSIVRPSPILALRSQIPIAQIIWQLLWSCCSS